MAGYKRKTAKLRLLNEIKKQLILQAERWGKKGYYTPLKLEELELDQCDGIYTDFLAERCNLDYEFNLLDCDTHETLIKLERLEGYIKKAKRAIKKHRQSIKKHLDKMVTEKDKLKSILARLKPENNISVLISSN